MTVHLDRGYGSATTRTLLAERGLEAEIAQRGLPAPIQAGMRWPVERTHAWGNAFNRLQRCYDAVNGWSMVLLTRSRHHHFV